MPQKKSTPFVSVFDAFRKIKRSGNYRRQIKKRVNELVCITEPSKEESTNTTAAQIQQQQPLCSSNLVDDSPIESNHWIDIDDDSRADESQNPTLDINQMGTEFRKCLSKWAVEHHVNQSQLRGLLLMCNNILPFQLPADPRTIFRTPRDIVIQKFSDGGSYWHRGLKESLCCKLENIDCIPQKITLNVNIDGLPICNSSNNQFWPILYNIHELHSIEPGVAGIFCGKGKKIYLFFKCYCFFNRIVLLQQNQNQ